MMLLAGLLGAIVVHLLPMNTMLDFEPGVLSLFLVALVLWYLVPGKAVPEGEPSSAAG